MNPAIARDPIPRFRVECTNHEALCIDKINSYPGSLLEWFVDILVMTEHALNQYIILKMNNMKKSYCRNERRIEADLLFVKVLSLGCVL